MSDLSEDITVNYKYKRRSAADIYHCFSKQEEAIEYANSEGNSAKVFSYEVSRGKRRFISCSAEAFWDMYDNLPEDKRRHYEVIVSTSPVKLYFDIEFYRSSLNCNKNGPDMVRQFVNLVNTRLLQMCDVTSVPENVLVLDSSNDIKFSCHLVFLEAIFSNYEACKQFVLDLVQSLSEARLIFEVKDKNENTTLMIDLLVYTRNRNMRLIGSSKFGEHRPIMLSEDDLASEAIVEKLHLGGSVTSKEVQKEVFMKSLITNVSDDCSMITCYPSLQQQPKQPKQPVAFPSSGVSGTAKSMTSSSHPKLDSFITDLVSPGRIRKVLYNKETIRFEVAGNRRCQKIGRDHTSNHIFYVYYKTSEKLFQDCYSPSCTSLDPIEIMIN